MRTLRPAHGLVLALVVVPSILVAAALTALYMVVIPLFPVVHQYYFTQQVSTFDTYRVPLYGHILFGAIALTLGPINLVNALRGRGMRRHRLVGGCYAIAVAVSAPCAVFLSIHAYPGTTAGGRFLVTSGVMTLGLAWIATLALALRAILVRHDIRAHRFWIIANISLTFAAVVIRAEIGIANALGAFETLYPVLAWVSWVPNLVVAVLIARRLNAPSPGKWRVLRSSHPPFSRTRGIRPPARRAARTPR